MRNAALVYGVADSCTPELDDPAALYRRARVTRPAPGTSKRSPGKPASWAPDGLAWAAMTTTSVGSSAPAG